MQPNDPGRRTRILHAALEVIASQGVQAATCRHTAAQAGGPLGSMTNYFSNLETLVVSAFHTLRDELESRYAALKGDATTAANVLDLLTTPAWPGRHQRRRTLGSPGSSPRLTRWQRFQLLRLYPALAPRIHEVRHAALVTGNVRASQMKGHATETLFQIPGRVGLQFTGTVV